MELTIKTAEEYRQQQADIVAAEDAAKDTEVVTFIETEIKPKIEDKIANPTKYNSHDSVAIRMKAVSNPDDFCDRVAKILKPKGFRVEKTHDGGGLYDVIVVRWAGWNASVTDGNRTSGKTSNEKAQTTGPIRSALVCAVKTMSILARIDTVPYRTELEAAIVMGTKALEGQSTSGQAN